MSRVLDLWSGLTGAVLPYAGITAPADWMLCGGQAVSRTTYAALFAVIGVTYGAGDGSTTFNVPDLRGRVPAGLDNMGGNAAGRLTTAAGGVNAAVLGAVGGSSTHTLTEAQMPAHDHTITVTSAGAHTHTVTGSNADNGTSGSYFSTANDESNGNRTIASAGAHVHTATAANAGSGGAHPNVQPTMALNHIIRF